MNRFTKISKWRKSTTEIKEKPKNEETITVEEFEKMIQEGWQYLETCPIGIDICSVFPLILVHYEILEGFFAYEVLPDGLFVLHICKIAQPILPTKM